MLAVAVLLSAGSLLLGQNLLVNGSFDDPALARITINSPGVADGDTVELDINGTNRVYEFDTNNSVVAGRVRVDVASGGTGATNAHSKLRAAINADTLAPCTASGSSTTTLTWKGTGGVNAVNANTVDANGTISVTDFADPAACPSSDGVAVLGWTGLTKRNGTFFVPACRDGAHASMDGQANMTKSFSQTVTVTPGTTYTLKGVWWLGHQSHQFDPVGAGTTAVAELRDGPLATGTLLGSDTAVRNTNGDTGQWLSFAANGTAIGTQMTVVLKGTHVGIIGWALHVDATELVPATCLLQPTVTSVAPTYSVQGSVLNNVAISGSNFTAGNTAVKLTQVGQPDIVATNVNVVNTSSLTCTLDLAGARFGRWDVVVTVGDTSPNQLNCGPATLNAGFEVILPTLSNGSFELPTAAGGCPVTPLPGVPTDWSFIEVAAYGYNQALLRDLNVFTPSCPPPDGAHYGSSYSNHGAGAQAVIYQTIAVTPGTGYSVSGSFAGGGANTVKLELHDGNVNAGLLSSATVHESAGVYDWTYASVFGQPTTDVMTVAWFIDVTGAGPHAAHADNLAIEVCNTPLDVVGVQPNTAMGDGVVTITNLAGSGFVFGGTPLVQLVRGNTRITATDVVVLSGTQISCKFDLTGAMSGKYALAVKQGGCWGILPSSSPDAFRVVAAEFINGDFEDPEAPLNCGPPPVIVTGVPTGWNTDANLVRDGNAPVPPSCPSPANGHYASLASDQAGFLRAWQTIRVLPGQSYTFKGWFGGPSDAFIQLVDGFEDGNLIASTQAVAQGDGGAWREASVAGTAVSGVLTIIWQVEPTIGNPGGHADGLQFSSNCHTIWADADDDGDVDMDDFADWQRCVSITGTGPNDPPYCRCYDRVAPYGQVDELDFPSFAHCVSGPSVPWTGCNP